MKNSAILGGCYLRSSEFFVSYERQIQSFLQFIHSKYTRVLKGVCHFALCLFVCQPRIKLPRPQVFSVNGPKTYRGLPFLWNWFHMTKLFPNLVNHSWLWNYVFGFKKRKYFERRISKIIALLLTMSQIIHFQKMSMNFHTVF